MDYLNVEPDFYALLDKHFTPGRGGAKIEFITRHHLAMVGDAFAARNVWQTREASAHYVVGPDGRVGQVVNDCDTAWANANLWANQRTIAIEHSNAPGAGWPISDLVIERGAKLAAALCRYYNLGRPVFGKNIRDHKEFYGTSCPYHLAKGGKYHDRWMRIAQEFYDELSKPKPAPAPKHALKPKEQKEKTTMGIDLNKQYTSFVPGSTFKAPLGEFIMTADRAAFEGKRNTEQLLQVVHEQEKRLARIEEMLGVLVGAQQPHETPKS